MSTKTITPKELFEKRQAGEPVELIDVRTPVEFREVHAEGSKLLPLDRLDPDAFLASRNGQAGRPVYLICRTGNRANMACEKFAKAGYADVVNVEGGTQAWEAAGLPVKRGKKAMSLERQVRIAAGSLVLLGVALGFLTHPAFFGLSAFVGAGLVFAGVTDTCGMGMLLGRMPWNQVKIPAEECAVQATAGSVETKAGCCAG